MVKTRHTLPFAAVLAAASLHAQVIRGTVRDQVSHLPLPNTTVSILNERDSLLKSATTSEVGQFSMRMPAGGVFALAARRVGYLELTTTAFPLGKGDTLTLELQLASLPVFLDTVHTKARPDSGLLTKVTPGRLVLAAHYRLGKGIFVSGAMIEKSGMSLTEYLGHVKGIRLSGLHMPGTPVIPGANGQFLVSNLASQCLYARIDHWSVLLLMIQGAAGHIDEILGVKNIMAVEFYRDKTEIPPEWLTDAALSEVWTRSYSMTYRYTDSTDRYAIGVTGYVGPLQVQQDTVYPPNPPISSGRAGYGALPYPPNSMRAIPVCGFMQIWTKAAW